MCLRAFVYVTMVIRYSVSVALFVSFSDVAHLFNFVFFAFSYTLFSWFHWFDIPKCIYMHICTVWIFRSSHLLFKTSKSFLVRLIYEIYSLSYLIEWNSWSSRLKSTCIYVLLSCIYRLLYSLWSIFILFWMCFFLSSNLIFLILNFFISWT